MPLVRRWCLDMPVVPSMADGAPSPPTAADTSYPCILQRLAGSAMAAPVFRWGGGGGAVAGLRRCLSRRAVHHASVPTEMAAWQIHRYGGTEELQVRLGDLTCMADSEW